nr:hypothetical protein [uncultured Clostridium sp.]
MSRKQMVEVSFRCEKCGKPQGADKEKSTDNFEVFNCHKRCECGGKFVMYLGNEKAE